MNRLAVSRFDWRPSFSCNRFLNFVVEGTALLSHCVSFSFFLIGAVSLISSLPFPFPQRKFPLAKQQEAFLFMSELLVLLFAGVDQPQADQANSLAEGLPL
eukprot:677428-Pelagomonas_calceolata.AAC.2